MTCVFEYVCFFFSSRRRHTRYIGDWSSDVCSSDLDAVHFTGERINEQTESEKVSSGFAKPKGGCRSRATKKPPCGGFFVTALAGYTCSASRPPGGTGSACKTPG